MNWLEIKNTISKSAPVLGGLLGPLGGVAGSIIATALNVDNTPEAIAEAYKNDPDALIKIRQAEQDNKQELQKLLIQQEMLSITETNKTMRAELTADNKYKSYWRPTFGYVGAIAWAVQTITILGVFIFSALSSDIHKVATLLDSVIGIISALTPQWAILLSVLGINIHKRSVDKQNSLGIQTSGILSKLLK